ncbi:MAG TPA: alpha/beta fold hydrolase [Polyangiaceae bacterium]
MLIVAFALAGCGQKKAPSASEPATRTPSTTASGGVAKSGTVPSASSGELGRLGSSTGRGGEEPLPGPDEGAYDAAVHVPSGLGANEKVPLVVVLHGYGASSSAIEEHTDFREFALKKRIAWVAPDGPKDKKGRQFWNAGSSCCNFENSPVDHVRALRRLVERALERYPIDAKRVYFVGFSNGGFMAHRIACELGGLVAGVVSVSGAGRKPNEACPATAPVRVLQVHGDADPVVEIGGGHLFRDDKYPIHLSAAQTVGDWAKRFGCKPKPKAVGSIDFEDKLPGAETKVERFEGCQRGAVELWTVHGGNHYIGFRAPAHEAMWKFLSGS